MKTTLLLLSVCGLLAFAACKKDDISTKHAEFWECNNRQNWDSTSIRNTLVGTWDWQYVNRSNERNTNAYKGWELELQPNGNLIVFQDGVQIQTAIWTLKKLHGGTIDIETKPYIVGINGLILICGDQIGIITSDRDGPDDNYFKRK